MVADVVDRNLEFYTTGSDELAIWTHGGFTPRRKLKPGSGWTNVPNGVTFHFHTPDDSVGAGDKGGRYIANLATHGDNQVFETCTAGDKIRDYSLSLKETDNKGLTGNNQVCDYVLVTLGEKAHVSDIFKVMRDHDLNYSTIRYFACRINKVTYSDEVTPPTIDREFFFRIHGRYPDE